MKAIKVILRHGLDRLLGRVRPEAMPNPAVRPPGARVDHPSASPSRPTETNRPTRPGPWQSV